MLIFAVIRRTKLNLYTKIDLLPLPETAAATKLEINMKSKMINNGKQLQLEPDLVTFLCLAREISILLIDRDIKPRELINAVKSVEYLNDICDKMLRKAGWQDPAYLRELIKPEILTVIQAKDALKARIAELRGTTLPYFVDAADKFGPPNVAT